MRLFIGLNVPAKEKRKIHEAARALRETEIPVRWTDPELYHLTLKFLGDVREERVEQLERVVQEVAAATPPVDLHLEGVGAFPTIRRPRVLWLGVEPTPVLRCLKQDLEWALGDVGFERDGRAFHPHVTLARARGDEEGGAFRGLDDLAADIGYAATVEVATLDLIRSHRKAAGPEYEVIASGEFDGAPVEG